MTKEDIMMMKNACETIMNCPAEIRFPAIMTALDYTLAELNMTMEDVLKIRNEVIDICGEV